MMLCIQSEGVLPVLLGDGGSLRVLVHVVVCVPSHHSHSQLIT